MSEQRFSEEEVADILRRASSESEHTGLSRVELMKAAQEAGIDPARVEMAIGQSHASVPAFPPANKLTFFRQYDFGVEPEHLPLVLSELPPMGERMARLQGGLVSTVFEHKLLQYTLRCSSDGSTTRLEVRASLASRHAFAFLAAAASGMVILFMTGPGSSRVNSEQFLGFLLLALACVSLPYVLIGRTVTKDLSEIGSRIEARLKSLAR